MAMDDPTTVRNAFETMNDADAARDWDISAVITPDDNEFGATTTVARASVRTDGFTRDGHKSIEIAVMDENGSGAFDVVLSDTKRAPNAGVYPNADHSIMAVTDVPADDVARVVRAFAWNVDHMIVNRWRQHEELMGRI
jgi:predicted short-subunit dehydrogenase-like oxidoreductase (DUF2520 family)